jgi:hypothetical protein
LARAKINGNWNFTVPMLHQLTFFGSHPSTKIDGIPDLLAGLFITISEAS